MPDRTAVREAVLDSSVADWEFMDGPPTWVLWSASVTATEVGHRTDGGRQDVDQPGFVDLPPAAGDQLTRVRVAHAGTPVDQFPVLVLDGGRTTMVQPGRDPNDGARFLTEYEAQLSRVLSSGELERRLGSSVDVEVRGRGVRG